LTDYNKNKEQDLDKEFEDIRPYRDHEIRQVLDRIRKHPWIISALRRFVWPRCPNFIVTPFEALIRFYLRLKLYQIHNVDDFHRNFMKKTVLEWIAERTMKELTASRLEDIDPKDRYIFITNHRDIVLDSAFLCYFLMEKGMKTPEIAFGDNLLINEFVSDLIRINKSFLVKRNLPVREQMHESLRLSRYIWYRLNMGSSIWIAQKGGRAKEGDDRTNPSLIKMLYLAQRKSGMSFSDSINALKIIPVAISYEYDPCDQMKAKEVYKSRTQIKYEKRHREDLISILKGINEYKGRVHYSFGYPPLHGNWEDAKHVASEIDRFIHANYRLWPTNYMAYDMFFGTNKYKEHYTEEEVKVFLKRFEKLPEEIKKVAIEIYAKPVINREATG